MARVRELCDNAARRGAPCTGSALLRRRYVSTSVIARTSLFFTACFLYSFLAICAHLTVLLTEISKRRVRPCAPSTKQQAVRSRARSACAVCARVDGLCLVESIQARATAGLRPREHAWTVVRHVLWGPQQTRARALCETSTNRGPGGTCFLFEGSGFDGAPWTTKPKTGFARPGGWFHTAHVPRGRRSRCGEQPVDRELKRPSDFMKWRCI